MGLASPLRLRLLGADAVRAMLGHLLDAFLLSAAPLATDSERQRNSNPRKLYPADLGLIKAFDASGRSNLGHALKLGICIVAAVFVGRWKVPPCCRYE